MEFIDIAELVVKKFQEKVWVVRTKKMILLCVLTVILLIFFVNYQLRSRDYTLDGSSHQQKIKKIREELRHRQDLKRQQEILASVNKESIADGSFLVDVTKIQSDHVKETAKGV
jgi:hypothetical protein